MHTEVIAADYPLSRLLDDYKRNKIEDLLNEDTFLLVIREEIESFANMVPQFFLAIKKNGDGTEIYKERFVLG